MQSSACVQVYYLAVQFPMLGLPIFIQSFPYSIVFYERKDEIVIVAFAHSSRRPGYWRSRGLL